MPQRSLLLKKIEPIGLQKVRRNPCGLAKGRISVKWNKGVGPLVLKPLVVIGTCAATNFFSSRRRHTRLQGDWSSDVCSSDLGAAPLVPGIERNQLENVGDGKHVPKQESDRNRQDLSNSRPPGGSKQQKRQGGRHQDLGVPCRRRG